jgi:CBS domain-containing protein
MPNRPVSEVIGDRPVPTARVSATVREVARIMQECRSSAVLIIERGKLAGICTERDIVFGVVAAGKDATQTRVDEVMTQKVRTIGPEKPFGHALHMMYEGGFRHVPVVDASGHPLGLLAAHDALDVDGLQLEKELVRREEITVIL